MEANDIINFFIRWFFCELVGLELSYRILNPEFELNSYKQVQRVFQLSDLKICHQYGFMDQKSIIKNKTPHLYFSSVELIPLMLIFSLEDSLY